MGVNKSVIRLVLSALLTGMALGQQNQASSPAYAADRANVPDAIAKVKSGNFALIHIDLIAKARAVEAVPVLKDQFARTQDPLIKAKIASALVRLGERDEVYWDFLVKQATSAVESDAPDFMNYDSSSNDGGGPSPAFVTWAKTHGEPVEKAGQNSMYWLPAKMIMLGSTGDPRAIPLLRRGLLSPNHQIEIAAAMGLAEIQDKSSVSLIIDACNRAPAGAAAVIAESLIYFDEADAQNEVEKRVPKERSKILRDSMVQGHKTPLGFDRPQN